MGRNRNERRYAENQAMAKGRLIKTSPQKMNLVARMICGKKAEVALADLSFCRKRVAAHVKTVLESAIANAENNHSLDIDSLVVDRAFVGKNTVMKRWRARARGRTGRIHKPFSEITVVVKEVGGAA